MEIMEDLFRGLLQPSNLLALLCLAGLLGSVLKWRWSRFVAGVAALLLAAASALPLGGWLVLPLENRFPEPKILPATVDGVIVLGGAVANRVTFGRGQASLNEHAERMTEAAALARRYPKARILFTGGNRKGVSEADVARLFFKGEGIASGRILFEQRARSTYDNAVFSRALAAPKAGETWLLVTSAYHMPRAIGAFRKAGFAVIPYPVDYFTPGSVDPTPALDVSGNLSLLDAAVREWASLAAYYATGRTNALFPA